MNLVDAYSNRTVYANFTIHNRNFRNFQLAKEVKFITQLKRLGFYERIMAFERVDSFNDEKCGLHIHKKLLGTSSFILASESMIYTAWDYIDIVFLKDRIHAEFHFLTSSENGFKDVDTVMGLIRIHKPIGVISMPGMLKQ